MNIVYTNSLTKRTFVHRIASVLGELFKGNRILCKSNFFWKQRRGTRIFVFNCPRKKNQPVERLAGTVDIIRELTMSNRTANNTIKQGNKTLGVIDNDTLRIIKTSPIHFVKKYQGYGVSESTIAQAESSEIPTLELQGYDGEKFKLSIRDFRASAIPDDLGSGRQLFLSVKWLRYYTKKNQDGDSPKQMSMF